MFESCAQLASELDEVESGLADPAVHADQAQARELALADAKVQKFIDGKKIKKFIYVPGRVVNVVVG